MARLKLTQKTIIYIDLYGHTRHNNGVMSGNKQFFLLLFLAILSITLWSEIPQTLLKKAVDETPSTNETTTPSPYNLDRILSNHAFFNSQELTVAIFSEIQPTKNNESQELEEDHHTISIGLFDDQKTLVHLIFQQDFFQDSQFIPEIHNVETKDLNKDGFTDLIINITDNPLGYYKVIQSHFFINDQNNGFSEIKEIFSKDTYEFLSPSIIQHTSSLSKYGNPNESEDDEFSTKHNIQWKDYYEFQANQLIKINKRYRNYYISMRNKANSEMNKVLDQIKNYRMNATNQSANQLQLNEYFAQLTTQKIVIQRCNTVLD